MNKTLWYGVVFGIVITLAWTWIVTASMDSIKCPKCSKTTDVHKCYCEHCGQQLRITTLKRK